MRQIFNAWTNFSKRVGKCIFPKLEAKGVTHPRPTKIRIALKLVCLSQLLYVNPGTNYEVDGTPRLIDFIKNTISEKRNTN